MASANGDIGRDGRGRNNNDEDDGILKEFIPKLFYESKTKEKFNKFLISDEATMGTDTGAQF